MASSGWVACILVLGVILAEEVRSTMFIQQKNADTGEMEWAVIETDGRALTILPGLGQIADQPKIRDDIWDSGLSL